jgi:dTDP-4-amino-4,6-dideoxygalactose transaminase
MAARIDILRRHGSRVKYHADILGINSRLDSVHAAVLDVKLRYLDG